MPLPLQRWKSRVHSQERALGCSSDMTASLLKQIGAILAASVKIRASCAFKVVRGDAQSQPDCSALITLPFTDLLS
eukprot:8786-Heterococcus_DN1.PRE.1